MAHEAGSWDSTGQAGVWQEGIALFWLRRAGGTRGEGLKFTPPPPPHPTLLFLKENQRRGFNCSPCKTPTPFTRTSQHPHPASPLSPLTLKGGLRPAGPGHPRTPLLLLQGCPDVVLQAVRLLLEQTYPPRCVRDRRASPAEFGQGWDSNNPRDMGPGALRKGGGVRASEGRVFSKTNKEGTEKMHKNLKAKERYPLALPRERYSEAFPTHPHLASLSPSVKWDDTPKGYLQRMAKGPKGTLHLMALATCLAHAECSINRNN